MDHSFLSALILLLLVLAFYGLWLLYSGPEHSTFGAKGFAEWLGLFLWGFGAQVVALSFRDISFTLRQGEILGLYAVSCGTQQHNLPLP